MRQNVFKRNFVRFKDWFLGVDDNETGTTVYDDWGMLKDSMLSLKMPVASTIWLNGGNLGNSKSPWTNIVGDTEWARILPGGSDHMDAPLIPVLTLPLKAMLSHMAVWAAANHAEDWTIMSSYDRDSGYERQNGTVFTTNEELKTRILAWWDQYSKRFVDTSKQFPHVEDGVKLNGILVESISCDGSNMTDKAHAEWRWLNENCEHDIKLVNSILWLFEDETEAMMFKLSKQ